MPKQKKTPQPRRRFAIPLMLGIAVVLGIVLATSGFVFAATQEEHDTFCASCHTQPESTFYQRSVDAQAVDLASAHKAEAVRCIDCHSGSGIVGRVGAELLGTRNAAAWYTGTAVQPAKLTFAINDVTCLKCHAQMLTRGEGRNNHFHVFLARWQAADPKAGTCASCHAGHATDGDASTRFMNDARTRTVCEACHSALGGGED